MKGDGDPDPFEANIRDAIPVGISPRVRRAIEAARTGDWSLVREITREDEEQEKKE